jgi:hypothetical protein
VFQYIDRRELEVEVFSLFLLFEMMVPAALQTRSAAADDDDGN